MYWNRHICCDKEYIYNVVWNEHKTEISACNIMLKKREGREESNFLGTGINYLS